MEDKQFDPAGNNEKAPAKGMAAVNTHNAQEVQNEPSNPANNERQSTKSKNDKHSKGFSDDKSNEQ